MELKRALLPVALLLLLCSCGRKENFFGYAEGHRIHVASPTTGRVDCLYVHRGERVAEGDRLFSVDSLRLDAAVAAAEAAMEKAAAAKKDLAAGIRAEELEILHDELNQAEAVLRKARQTMERRRALVERDYASVAELETLTAEVDAAIAMRDCAAARLANGKRGAREWELVAADHAVEIARRELDSAKSMRDCARPLSPCSGVVCDTFFSVGEVAPAGVPIVSMEEDGALRMRFFVPQEVLARLKLGQSVHVSTDGIREPIGAVIDFFDTRPEVTPPVIYSNRCREKLLFRVEAVPNRSAAGIIHAGQPITVRLD
ncbi:MAG: HlyD family efflux transporter periplasmic adaptor subunit [Puniceicoccales bacterium]|jgi:HlyD family secretion protein|nr:HlyD family efflux transporter periplasmic adaptor subunit [Puniceicoccales bacterium]